VTIISFKLIERQFRPIEYEGDSQDPVNYLSPVSVPIDSSDPHRATQLAFLFAN